MLDRFEETAFKLDENWAPRLGFIWDVTKNGKSKLYANYGRFYENIPQDINIRAFGGEVVCFCHNFSSNPADIAGDPAAPRARRCSAAAPSRSTPSSRASTSTSTMGGFEYEVAPNFVLGAKFTYRNLGRVIEDFLVVDEGSYFIANPGEGDVRQGADVLRLLPLPPRPRPSARTTASRSTRASASRTTGSCWPATCGASSRATTTASSRTRPASSTRTSTRPSTTPTSRSTPRGRCRPSASTSSSSTAATSSRARSTGSTSGSAPGTTRACR